MSRMFLPHYLRIDTLPVSDIISPLSAEKHMTPVPCLRGSQSQVQSYPDSPLLVIHLQLRELLTKLRSRSNLNLIEKYCRRRQALRKTCESLSQEPLAGAAEPVAPAEGSGLK